jgi:NAD(P)H-flavin reductase
MGGSEKVMDCELICHNSINREIFRLDFVWPGEGRSARAAVPKAGQFFMIKPQRSAVFLARPISVAQWQDNTLSFLIALRGKGTQELAAMQNGEKAELIGPLGNAWTDFLPSVENGVNKPIALVGGGIGLAPLNALLAEKTKYQFDLYAGFRTGFETAEEKITLLGTHSVTANIIVATEDGKEGHKGRITDFLEPEKYAAVCACGPQPMLKAVAEKCKAANVSCFISMERRMACGVGACLGCTVHTVSGNRRCCADGPIFKAEEVVFDE